MPRILVLGWLVVALMGHPSAGQSGSTTITARSADGEDVEEESTVMPCAEVLEKQKAMEEGQKAMEQELKSLRQAVLSPSLFLETKVNEAETKLELSVLESTLLIIQMKLEIAEMKIKALDSMEIKLEAAETTLKYVQSKLQVAESKLETTATTLQAMQSVSNRNGASTFVRWGRKTCSNSTTQLVYSGVAGGSYYDHPGGAVNALCLTRSPQFDSTPKPVRHAYLYGAEYENIPNHQDHEVPCAVCRTPHSTTIMIPSTHACPAGWTVEYAGHLVAGRYVHQAASEYLCLDEDLEDVSSEHGNDNGYLLYYVVYQCGSLPCPPYVANKVVLCVVCSM